ncbi:TMV resistance protein N, partial [Mucuna pruriens]
MAQPAASSSWIYDVFLSFTGEDTRHTFTGNLYNSLRVKGIHTFIDEEGLRRGEEITPALLKAIQNSRIAIIVFSINYASSTYCLVELVKILECCKEEGQSIYPIFYNVDPSQVKQQTGTYSEAFAKHEERLKDDNDKVKKWRKALYQAANLSGWHFRQGSQPEYKFIWKIVEEVSKKINCIPLHVADNPIGLEYAVLEVKSLLGHGSDVNMIGIHGIGGIGKTTIARAVYNSFFSMCFLPDIREKAINKHGLVQLQEMLLSEVLKEKDIKVGDVYRGIPIIKRRLQQKKVLLVLDDVDQLEQLKVLAGEFDWFGPGSIIIITTRNTHLLATHGVVNLYEVKPLNVEKALELFNWHAFKNNIVDPCYVDVSNRAVLYARGLPLALEVIGSHLFGKSLIECNSALNKYERIPHEKILAIFKVSFDGLEENEKGIFLDIACFFNSSEVDYVTQMLHAHGFHAKDGLRVLVDRSLIKIISGFVEMHDLIRDTGREIVRQESVIEPGRRSRLWFNEDIVHVLEENTGTDKIEFIKLEGYNNIEVQWNGEAFKKMKNLKILIIKNTSFSTGPEYLPNSLRVLDWGCYPSPSLSSDIIPKQLQILRLRKSCLEIFQSHKACISFKVFILNVNFYFKLKTMLQSLSTIKFEQCRFLTNLPSLTEVPLLTNLCLDKCTNLVEIDCSIGFHDKLSSLSAQGCSKLKSLAPCIKLTSLEILNLKRCTSLESFPEVLVKMEKIREIYLDETAIEELPFSVENFIGLELLSVEKCKRLNQLPRSIYTLRKLEVIFGYGRWGYRFFEENRDEQELSTQVSPKAMFVCYHRHHFSYVDVYYPYVSPNNVIQICSPNPSMYRYFHSLFRNLARGGEKDWFRKCKRWSTHFSFRNKFPKIAVCWSIVSKLKSFLNMVFIFKFSVVVNGIEQFTSSFDYIFRRWDPILWCDLQCEAEGIFSEHEWNEVEIIVEFKYPTPSRQTMEANNITMSILDWTLIGVYEEGNNKDDVEFRSPMSTLLLGNTEPTPSFPSCLYYVVGHEAE